MSKVVIKDWEFSDAAFAAPSIQNLLEKQYGPLTIRKSTKEEDIHNNIDYKINNKSVQWRVQRHENIKGHVGNYGPTFRYSRSFSSHEDRKDSELKKIVRNMDNGLPYPEHHIWCLVDKNIKIIKFMIVDVNKFVSDFKNEEYEIWYTKLGKKINNSNTGKIISLRQNYDNSSEFISLNEKYLLPNTIIYKYISN